MKKDPIVVLSYARTPIGKMLGILKDFSAVQLGSAAIQDALHRIKLAPDKIDAIFMGCVLQAGLQQAPARQAGLLAGLSPKTTAVTINKVCGSGLEAVSVAMQLLQTGAASVVVAGGMESMTNAPHLLPKARLGYRLGSQEILDHLMLDGLEDAYDKRRPMGYFAEALAKQKNLSRERQDAFAMASFERARQAIASGKCLDEITPITLRTKKGEEKITQDEHPFSVDPARIPTLPPIFDKAAGTITAGNASAIADGAAALILTRLSIAEKLQQRPLAILHAVTSIGRAPHEFPLTPIHAIQKLLEKQQRPIHEIDLFEINEAFAAVPLFAMEALHIPHDKINIRGGAVALGHPIGASGARVLVTLLSALKEKRLKHGIASLCIGGGEGIAIAVEYVDS